MLSEFWFGESRSRRVDRLTGDMQRAREQQAMSSLYVREAAGQAVIGADRTIKAARAAAAIVGGKR